MWGFFWPVSRQLSHIPNFFGNGRRSQLFWQLAEVGGGARMLDLAMPPLRRRAFNCSSAGLERLRARSQSPRSMMGVLIPAGEP